MRVPKYRKNPDGRAFIEVKGRRIYLGRHGSADSRRRYDQHVSRLLAASLESPLECRKPGYVYAVSELVALYLEHAIVYYADDDGPTQEFRNVKKALAPLNLDPFAALTAEQFGPKQFDKLIDRWVAKRWTRGFINGCIGRIKRCFKWCVRKEYIRVEVYQRLLTVNLDEGRRNVRESRKVQAVPRADVIAVLPFLSPTVAAMAQTQYYGGMRPEEVCVMRRCDIDTSGVIWLYRPHKHKNQWRGHDLVKAIPPIAQKIIKPFFKPDLEAYIFSPHDAYDFRRNNPPRKLDRETPVYPSELRRRAQIKAERARRRRRSRQIRDRYSTTAYARAITYGIEKAERAQVEIPHWSPNQLRHAVATELRQIRGEEAAQIWLGHASLSTTALYTEKQLSELVALAQVLESHWSGAG